MQSADANEVAQRDELCFIPYSEEALQRYLPWLRACPFLCNDLSAGSLFMWQEGQGVQLCLWHDTFLVRQEINDQPAFSWPWGKDPEGMVERLLVHVRRQGLALRFFAVSQEQWEALREDPRLQPALAAYDVRWSDYLYDFEEALTFQGRKYSGQRNHINKFRKLYGEPCIRPIGPEDGDKIDRLLAEYAAEHADANALERRELQKARELLERTEALNLQAAYLAVGEEAVAFSIGEVVGESLLIHVEKALRRYEGAYPTMYQGFVRFVRDQLGRSLRWVNREDDSGDPGLRISKQQYQPLCQIHKILVHAFTPACRMPAQVVLRRDGAVLTPFREEDRAAYLALNTDVENNRLWGYDYREDETITGPIDEHTFYDMTQYDMRVGDSINLALRLSEEGPMVGEVILWHFTSDGRAELGCRILPAVQGRGLGKAAFGAALDFAEHTLGLRVHARCHRENRASYGMITACGLRLTGQDAQYCWFER